MDENHIVDPTVLAGQPCSPGVLVAPWLVEHSAGVTEVVGPVAYERRRISGGCFSFSAERKDRRKYVSVRRLWVRFLPGILKIFPVVPSHVAKQATIS